MAHPVRPDEYQEINNFYTATVYEKGAELIRMQHDAARPRALPPRHGPLLRAPRRPRGHLRRFRPGDAGRIGRRPRAVPPLVRAGGHAGGDRSRQLRRRGAARTRSTSSSALPSATGQPAQAAAAHSVRRRPASAPTGATCRCASRREPAAGGDDAGARAHERSRSASRSSTCAAAPVPSLLRGFSAPVQARVRLSRRGARAARGARQRRRQSLGRGAAHVRQRDPARSRSAHRSGRAARAARRFSARIVARHCSTTRRAIRRCSRSRSRFPIPPTSPTLERTLDPDGIVAAWTFVETRARAAPSAARSSASYARHRPAAPYAPTPGAGRRAQPVERVPALPRRARRRSRARAARPSSTTAPTT